jgi:hypothetical protein
MGAVVEGARGSKHRYRVYGTVGGIVLSTDHVDDNVDLWGDDTSIDQGQDEVGSQDPFN